MAGGGVNCGVGAAKDGGAMSGGNAEVVAGAGATSGGSAFVVGAAVGPPGAGTATGSGGGTSGSSSTRTARVLSSSFCANAGTIRTTAASAPNLTAWATKDFFRSGISCSLTSCNLTAP